MKRFALVLAVLGALGCGDSGNRKAPNDMPATAADEREHFDNALKALGASSPPVVQHPIIYTPAVECEGHRCCDPT